MRLSLLALVAFASVAHASPTLVWSGTYTYSYDFEGPNGAPEITLTDDGVESFQSGMGFCPWLSTELYGRHRIYCDDGGGLPAIKFR